MGPTGSRILHHIKTLCLHVVLAVLQVVAAALLVAYVEVYDALEVSARLIFERTAEAAEHYLGHRYDWPCYLADSKSYIRIGYVVAMCLLDHDPRARHC